MSIFRNRGADTEVILHVNYDKNTVEFFITKLQSGFIRELTAAASRSRLGAT